MCRWSVSFTVSIRLKAVAKSKDTHQNNCHRAEIFSTKRCHVKGSKDNEYDNVDEEIVNGVPAEVGYPVGEAIQPSDHLKMLGLRV